MPYHKFKVDQRVIYQPAHDMMGDAGIVHFVTRLLPANGPDPQYRIRNAIDGRERAAAESELQDGT